MDQELKNYVEQYLSQGYSISSIRHALSDHLGERKAVETIDAYISEKADFIVPYIKSLRDQNNSFEDIRQVFLNRGYDREIVDKAISSFGKHIMMSPKLKLGLLVSLSVIVLVIIITLLPLGFIDNTSESPMESAEIEFQGELVDDRVLGAETIHLNLDIITEEFSDVDITYELLDSNSYIIESYSNTLTTGSGISDSISIPDLRPAEYSLRARLSETDEEIVMSFEVYDTDKGDDDATDDEISDEGGDVSDDESDSGSDENSSDVDDITGEIEEEIAEIVGQNPTNVVSAQDIFSSASEMPPRVAENYCANFPPDIEEDCMQASLDAYESPDDIDCEVVEFMGQEMCIVDSEEYEMDSDSYCDYISDESAKETCEMISLEYDGLSEVIDGSEMGLDFPLIAFYDDEYRQIDFDTAEDD